jgi:radical SAM superfamily enzyme
VIGRITGDGGREALLAPLWSLKKLAVMNILDRKMKENGTVQGAKWDKTVQN